MAKNNDETDPKGLKADKFKLRGIKPFGSWL